MFNELTQEQVTQMWPVLRESLLGIVGTGQAMKDAKKADELLYSLMIGDLVAWGLYKEVEEDKISLMGLITTSITSTAIGKERQLLIYTAMGNLSSEEFKNEAVPALTRYAQANGCGRMVTYSDNESVIELLGSIGCNVSTRFIYVEV